MMALVWIPPPIIELKETLKFVEMQNVGLGTGNCRILNSFPKNSRMVLKAARGKAGEVFPRSRGGLLSFGLRRIHIGFPQNKAAASELQLILST